MIIKMNQGIPLEDVLYSIEYADGSEIDEMIHAVRRRYSRLFPDWEIFFLSIQSGSETERRQQVEHLIEFLEKKYLP